MRLTKFSDYSLRVLMYAGASRDRLVTIDETARVYNISRTHLMKVVTALTREGLLEGVRGRSGGFRLAREPEEIRLGDVLRITEPDFEMVECFQPSNQCVVTACCRLPRIIGEGLGAFFAVFDRYTLADMALQVEDFIAIGSSKPATVPCEPQP